MALCLNETINENQVMALRLNETITEYQVMALHFFLLFFHLLQFLLDLIQLLENFFVVVAYHSIDKDGVEERHE